MTEINVSLRGPDWHAARSRVIGASEVAALFDCAPAYALSRYALFHVKAGNAPPPPVDNPRVRWGLRLEEAIAAGCEEEYGWTLTKGHHVTASDTPGMGCTLDYIIAAPGADETGFSGPGALELKNVDWLAHKRSWEADEPPPHILLQLQHQLGCTGYSWGAIVCLVGGNDLRVYRYAARPKLIGEIKARIRQFWDDVREGREPPVDGSEGASAVLRSLYPEVIDDAVDMSASNEWAEAAYAFWEAGEARRAADKTYETAKNRVVALLGDHRRGYGNGWSVNTAVTPASEGKPIRPEDVGLIVGGRKETRRYTVKEMTS